MGVHLSMAEAVKLGLVAPEKKVSKHRSIKTTIDGIVFASRREGSRYEMLKLLQRAGKVLKFELQPEFVLQPGYRRNGRWVRPIKYRADFKIWWRDGRITIEDVKPASAYRTEKYRIKKKLLLARYSELNFVES
jgi:hypothetical protein